MKTLIVYLLVLLFTSLLYGQSSIVYGPSTSLYVGTGADLCAGTITINGTFNGGGTFCNQPVHVENEDDLGTPEEFSLSQNYPNPFNPITTIKYSIPQSSDVSLKVYDILGKEVAVLVDEYKTTGTYIANFSASRLASRVYFYQLRSGDFVEARKMILMK